MLCCILADQKDWKRDIVWALPLSCFTYIGLMSQWCVSPQPLQISAHTGDLANNHRSLYEMFNIQIIASTFVTTSLCAAGIYAPSLPWCRALIQTPAFKGRRQLEEACGIQDSETLFICISQHTYFLEDSNSCDNLLLILKILTEAFMNTFTIYTFHSMQK